MNATPDQLNHLSAGGRVAPRSDRPGIVGRLRVFLWSWLTADMHLGEATFGAHSVTIGDKITMDTQAPSAAGQIGMNATTGRLQLYIGGSARDVLGGHEVVQPGGSVAFSGDQSMGGFKLTNLPAPTSSVSNDAARAAWVTDQINQRIATKVDVGYPGRGLIGKAAVAAISALTPEHGDVVIATDSGTPSQGTSSALTAGDVAEFQSTPTVGWIKILDGVGGFVPDGTRIIVSTGTAFIASSGLTSSTDEGKIASFDGTSNSPSALAGVADGVLVAVSADLTAAENQVLSFDGAVPTGVWRSTAAAGTAHTDLTGLTSGDDHTQYAKGAGRSSGQTLKGGTGSAENLVLESTAHGTKGFVQVASGSDLQLVGDDEIVPATSGNGYVGTSSKKFKEVRALNVYTGDLNMENDDGSFTLIESANAIRVRNNRTNTEGHALVVKPWVATVLRAVGIAS